MSDGTNVPVGWTGVIKVYDNTYGVYLGELAWGSILTAKTTITLADINLCIPNYSITALNSVFGTSSYTNRSFTLASNVLTPQTNLASYPTYEFALYVTSNYSSIGVLAANSYDISLRNVTGGSLSSTVSKASAGSSVSVTASPSTGYSLSSATVSGATNVSVKIFLKYKKINFIGLGY